MENNKKIEELINQLKTSNYLEILDKSILGDIENNFNNYLENYKRLESEDKILTIGIVGQVKAGKSSFLNTLFFESEDVLPKAATPMTAALTKIRYSENISAKVHFFTLSDFETVENGARECKRAIENERKKLNEELKKKGKPEVKLTDAQLLGMVELSDSSKAFYEIFENFKKNEGELRRKLENSENNDNNDNFEVLDNVDTIDALKNRLEDYVGVNGKYMPIVKYIEIFLNIEAIKDFDIVDTPGLNDPVISRGQLTRDFLGKCDVIFLLSPTSQFFDSQDISLFSEQLPQEGIKEVVVIGSKFDNGLIGESQKYNNDIKSAQAGVENVLNEQFKARINNSNRKDIFEKAFPPRYISSSCYDIYRNYGNLSKREDGIKKNIMRAFPHFLDDAESYKKLSGIEIFNSTIIPEIVSKKDNIFKERSNSIYYGFIEGFTQSIEELYKEVMRKQEELSNGDIKTLEDKVKSSLNNLEKLKHSIDDCYDEKTHEIKVKFNDLLTEIKDIIDMNSDVKKRQKTEDYTVMVEKDGILSGIARFFNIGGYRQETRTRNISYASTQDAIEQVNKIIKESQKLINNACKNVFDINDFCETIANKLLEVFDLSNLDFDTNSIILPLKKVLRSLSINSVRLDKDYTNIIIESVSDKEETSVEVMQKAMRKTVLDIIKDIEKALNSQSAEIVAKLDEQANSLISDISSSIEKDAEELKNQLKDKKKYEELYKEAVSGIEEIKNNI
ncbi:dynamin family protein [Brachyspira sp.]|uniref:dynamin family protein n=1 Tax=Brachyspira sp. TaxID=1977261 RepID=UPI003D7ED8D2